MTDRPTDPAPASAAVHRSISWRANTDEEIAACEYLVKAYLRMPLDNRVLALELFKRLDPHG